MIDAHDTAALLAALDSEDVTFTVSAGGIRKTFRESNVAKCVHASQAGRAAERAYLLEKRLIELARDILHSRGQLKV